MWKDPYDEYAQYEHNRTLSFALASMMYDPWTHAVLYHRVPGSGLELLGGGLGGPAHEDEGPLRAAAGGVEQRLQIHLSGDRPHPPQDHPAGEVLQGRGDRVLPLGEIHRHQVEG